MAHQDLPVSFVTFGMFIIDEIEWQIPNPPPSKYKLIGGAGTYAVLGARLAVSPSLHLSRTISWIVDIGSDFPAEVKSTIDLWNTNCIFRYDPNRLTTRAWNGYGADDLRAFKYLTPKVRLEVSSLNPAQVMAKSFHMVCSPDRCIDITTKLREARRAIDSTVQDPVIVWEPIPDLCSPAQLSRLQEAASRCTVISPNHEELKMFFPNAISKTETQSQLVSRLMGWNTTDQAASSLPISSVSNSVQPIVIVREGSNGSTAYIHSPSTSSTQPQPISIHLPAYHTPEMSSSVTDPTGGGNTYLGALAIALASHATDTNNIRTNKELELPVQTIISKFTQLREKQKQHREDICLRCSAEGPDINFTTTSRRLNIITMTCHAMIVALIAASFAIEQNGTPHLARPNGSKDGASAEEQKHESESQETWNNETVAGRTREYLERHGDMIREDMTRNMALTLNRYFGESYSQSG